MKPSNPLPNQEKQLIEALSLERFGRYRAWADADDSKALALYALNTSLSEALYTPLQMLEVCLRNRIHAVMTEAHHERWFEAENLLQIDYQREQMTKALEELARKQKALEPGRVVAELSFGFWTAMLGKPYENLWQTTLHRIARRSDGKGVTRKAFNRPLQPIREMRNRIAHHEPIIYWDLPKHYQAILELTSWLSPAAAAWCQKHSHFDVAYPDEGIALSRQPNASASKPTR